MRPILFSLGSLNFYSYGFFTAVSFILAGMLVDYLAKRKRLITSKQREFFVIDMLLFALVIGIVAARVGYIVVYNLIFPSGPVVFGSNIFLGGFIFYVGLAAGLGALGIWLHRQQMPLLQWLDVLIIGVLAGLSLSEIGGYLNDGQIIHLARTVISAIAGGIIYHILFIERRPGIAFFNGLMTLFLMNFFLGFWTIERVNWLGLGLGQWVALLGTFITLWQLRYWLGAKKDD